MAVIEGGTVLEGALERVFKNAGAPRSGSTGGTLRGAAPPDALLKDTTNDVLYINEGTLASPYWTPVDAYDKLLIYQSDFRDTIGKTIADTGGEAILAGSGLRIHGLGIVETDSGLTIVQTAEVGPVASLIATNEDGKLAAIGVGGSELLVQPDVNGPSVIDVVIAAITALTVRAIFVGFVGAAADAMTPRVTGDTVTLTLVDNDLAGILMDASLTDAAGLFAAHNKDNEAATLAVSATGVDTGTDMPAAGTYVRLRVEIDAAGLMTCFRDKVEIASIAASLNPAVEVTPTLYIESTDANTKTLGVKSFKSWVARV